MAVGEVDEAANKGSTSTAAAEVGGGGGLEKSKRGGGSRPGSRGGKGADAAVAGGLPGWSLGPVTAIRPGPSIAAATASGVEVALGRVETQVWTRWRSTVSVSWLSPSRVGARLMHAAYASCY